MSAQQLVGGTPITALQNEAIDNPVQKLQQNIHTKPQYPPQIMQQAQPSNGVHHNTQPPGVSSQPIVSSNSLLLKLKQGITIDDLYLPLFVAIVYYIGQKKIISRPLSEKFGNGIAVYAAIIIVFISSYIFNKYFLVR